MSREKGWEYLFGTDQKGGPFKDDEGNEGYIYSDGSGYFHGADGSDGYRYTDGSGYYRGSSGVDAYQYSDGSGYYEGADGNREHYNPALQLTKTGDVDGNSLTGLATATLFTLVGAGVSKFGDLVAEEMRAEREKERQRKERQAKFWRNHWKRFLILIAGVILAVLCIIGIGQLEKMIPMGYDSSTLIGKSYEDVYYLLQTAGFTNIKLVETEDLNIEDTDEENIVYQIFVNGKNRFLSTTRYPYDIKITVKYHAVKKIKMPFSHKEAKGKQHEEVFSMLEAAGFVNVRKEIVYDLITGWITEDGEVDRVIVNGNSKFDDSEAYRPDAEIVIIYHTFKKNEP